MRKIDGYELWVGHAGSVPHGSSLARTGIAAVVDLAMNETPRTFGREAISCRFPLTDGGGNTPGLVVAAVTAVAGLLQARVPTLVYCSMGLSRSPSIAAGALALASGRPEAECLALVTRGAPADVSPAMWAQVLAAVQSVRALGELGLGAVARPSPHQPG